MKFEIEVAGPLERWLETVEMAGGERTLETALECAIVMGLCADVAMMEDPRAKELAYRTFVCKGPEELRESVKASLKGATVQ